MHCSRLAGKFSHKSRQTKQSPTKTVHQKSNPTFRSRSPIRGGFGKLQQFFYVRLAALVAVPSGGDPAKAHVGRGRCSQ